MLSFSCGSGVYVWQNKNPTAGLAMGFDKFFKRNQNPTAARRSRSAFSSRFRFKLRFTGVNLTVELPNVKCYSSLRPAVTCKNT
jgi:hypothetical protein